MSHILLCASLLLSYTGCSQAPDDQTYQSNESAETHHDNDLSVVKPGIEVLRDSGFKILEGKKVGLITNPTGVDNKLKSTIDILAEADNVNLTTLFAPEHGVRGNYVAGASVENETDSKTGIKVYSLHGRTKKPTPEMLKDVDVLVYDIQDIGCRSYTFISTMGLAMEAAIRDGKEFVVLDRPNPLGGERVEGPLVDKGYESFVSQYPIPYIYGMTPGELATYLNESCLISGDGKVKLTVVPMEGWSRDMTFSDTNMPWVLPSPHIPTPQSAIMYPATGIMGELEYVSIGVGYTLPFSVSGAPWIDAHTLAANLNRLNLDGVMFRPIFYKPFYAFYQGQNIGGVQIYIDKDADTPLSLIQFYIMQELAALYPTHKAFDGVKATRIKMFDMVCGTSEIRKSFMKDYKVSSIKDAWNNPATQFKKETSKYYLYK